MEVQTWPEFAAQHAVRSDLVVAGADFIVLRNELQQIPRMNHRTVRAEITVPLHDPARKVYFRKLVRGDAYPWIGLGVLQEYIVLRLVLLYEIVLQKQRIRFGIDH